MRNSTSGGLHMCCEQESYGKAPKIQKILAENTESTLRLLKSGLTICVKYVHCDMWRLTDEVGIEVHVLQDYKKESCL